MFDWLKTGYCPINISGTGSSHLRLGKLLGRRPLAWFRQVNIVLLMIFPAYLFANNLTLLATFDPPNYELLDLELVGTLALVPAGIGGLSIIDVSQPDSPQLYGQFGVRGCSKGRIYAWHVAGQIAYGAGRDCGIQVIDFTDPVQPVSLGEYQTADARYEHSGAYGSYLYAATHTSGVEVIDRTNPGALAHIAWVPTTNALAVAVQPTGEYLYVADGSGGLKIIDIRAPADAQVIGATTTSGTARDLAQSGDYLFIAVGAAGVDMFDVSDPSNPLLVDNYNTSGYASRVAASGFRVAVADWDDVEVLQWDDSPALRRVGRKNTGGRVMAVAMDGDLVYTAEWGRFRTFRFGPVEGPDLDMSTFSLDFPRLQPGECSSQIVSFFNNGSSPLELVEASIQHPEFELEIPESTIPAREDGIVRVNYCASREEGRATLTIRTNDTNMPTVKVRLNGNPSRGVKVGDSAPNFTLSSVNGYPDITLRSLRGRVVLLALFASW